MKPEKLGGLIVGILTLTTVGGMALVIYRLELTMLYTLALILVGGIAFCIAAFGVAFALKAWRSTGPQEIQRIIERHTIEREGRVAEAPKIHLLDNRQSANPGMYPEILRSAYLAGLKRLPSGEDVEIVEGQTRDLTDEWGGRIRD